MGNPVPKTYPEVGLTTNEKLARARQIDYVLKFNDGLKRFYEVMGVTRKLPVIAGTTLSRLKATGTVGDGNVKEGELIPLTEMSTVEVPYGKIDIRKWRKATSIEAIASKGYDQAVTLTDNEILKKVQKQIKKNLFASLDVEGAIPAEGEGFQAAIANAKGKLEIAYEDTDYSAVFFVNPEDVYSYLGSAPITTQTAFGMSYIENFLGMGTAILTSEVEAGTFFATASENIVCYYINMSTGDIAQAFPGLTTDETGYIGVVEHPAYEAAQAESIFYSGVVFFAERIDGIVKGSYEVKTDLAG